MSDLIHRSDVEGMLNQMISDANNSMYPEGKVLEMKEFNVFSCGKASIEMAKDRLSSLPSIDVEKEIDGISEKSIIDFIKKQDTAQILQWCIINIGAKMYEMNADNLESSIDLQAIGIRAVAKITIDALPTNPTSYDK